MFRRIADRLAATVDPMGADIGRLTSLGFDQTQARDALRSTGGDVNRAAELLFASASGAAAPAPAPAPAAARDDALQNALEASRQSEEQRRLKQAQEASIQQQRRPRSAANSRAAQAAVSRAAKSKSPPPRSDSGGLSTHHPGVKVPKQLQHKAKEEQILRCADRLKSHPSAVDTLLRALTTIRNNPHNDKYRRVDKTNAGFQRSLANAPGAEMMLTTMNFRPVGANLLILDRAMVDDALLYLGISALEEAKHSTEYQEEKRKIAFVKEFREIREASDSSTEEAILRAEFLGKCPSEPAAGALMQVKIGPDTTIRRRFDGDDVLQDVLNWLGANGSVIPDKLIKREWCLVDLNRYPGAPIDCEQHLDKTLQFIGCWPSGKLEIRPSPQDWMEGGMADVSMGSSRGLGSAPTETLR